MKMVIVTTNRRSRILVCVLCRRRRLCPSVDLKQLLDYWNLPPPPPTFHCITMKHLSSHYRCELNFLCDHVTLLTFGMILWPCKLVKVTETSVNRLKKEEEEEAWNILIAAFELCHHSWPGGTSNANSKHWFTTSFLQSLPYLVTP